MFNRVSRVIFIILSSVFIVSFAFASTDNNSNKILDIQHWQTKNGAKVYFVQAKQLPMVNIAIAFNAGSSRDGKYPGLANFVNSMIGEGTKKLDANQIAAGFDNIGANFNGNTNQDMATFSLQTLTKNKVMQNAIALFGKVISQATFPEKSFKRIQQNLLASIKAQQQDPATIASNTFMQTLYGNYPYAHPVIGTAASINKITQADLIAFYKKYYVAKNAVIAIVGDITKAQAQYLAYQITQDLPKGEAATKLPSMTITKQENVHVNYPASQTYIRIGELGIDYQSPERYALAVGNYILGGGLTSRLFNTVREKYGYSYGAFSYFVPFKTPGPFIIALQTKNSTAKKAEEVTLEVLDNFIKNGPTEEEIREAKQYLLGSFPMRIDSNSKILNYLVALGFYQLPLNDLEIYKDKIKTVTAADIKAAFDKLINTKSWVIVSVGGNNNSNS